MTAPSADNILVGMPQEVSGLVLSAPTTATMPADAQAATTGFTALGHIGEGGIVENNGTQSTNLKSASGSIVRKLQTEHDVTYEFTMLETTTDTSSQFYGDDAVTAITDGHKIENSGAELPEKAYVFDMYDTTRDKLIRVVVPLGQITDRGQVTYVGTDAITYPVTVTAFADSSGIKSYTYIQDPAS